jgi:hypothetical protein
VLIGQAILHSMYGYETFLYSAHFGISLVMLAAFAGEVHRRGALVLACIVLCVTAANNYKAIRKAAVTVAQNAPVPKRLPSAALTRESE